MRLSLILAVCLMLSPGLARAGGPAHGLSMHGDLKYGPDFKHFDYVNPDAPKGGRVRLSVIGTYDTLNPFVIKGTPAGGTGLIYNALTSHAFDEPFSIYGELAETIAVADDLSSVTFRLRPNARWHDGQEITPEDVIFTFDLLKKQGRPFYRFYYQNVAKAAKVGARGVRFHFSGPKNRELPLIMGELRILPKHYWQDKEFNATTLEPPLGSGPYRIKEIDAGRSITLERVADYWAKDVPSQRGRYNFGQIRFEYYRDPTVAFEAFKSGAYDFRAENSAKQWATAYDFPALRNGQVIKTTLDDENPAGMQGFVFNTRRAIFKDRRVRWALAHTFDFEWSNKNLFYGQYKRTVSYFDNSELASSATPGADELALLEPFRGKIPDEVFTRTYAPPSTGGKGIRGNLRLAKRLLTQAGWSVKNGVLTNDKTGAPLRFEILIVQASFERVLAPMVANMKRLGVEAKIRLVDTSQYINRRRSFDFDMITASWGQSISPGNEQRHFWGSDAAERDGSQNYAAIKDPVVDQLINHVIFAKSRKGLVAATRALDRVLLWGHYVIPQFHIDKFRIAYWDRFQRPAVKPKYGIGFSDTWWVDAAKDAALKAKRSKQN